MNAILGLLALVASTAVLAQAPPAYPVKPIRMVVHSAAGSVPDVVVRIVSERLTMTLGQPIIVENRPGASGTIALAAVARAEPDGHTLGTVSPAQAVAPSLVPQLPYDTTRDLAAVKQIARHPLILLVRNASPSNSLADLVAAAKAHPGRISYASAGQGTPPHLNAELLRAHAGIEIHHVPYKGAPAAMVALLGEQVDLLFATPITAAGPMRSGKARALAVTGPARLATAPEVPTFGELGYSGLEVLEWQGVVAPAAVPEAIIQRIASEMNKALEHPEVRARLAAIGMEPVTDSGPAEFGKLIRSELGRWTRVVRETGMRLD